MDNLERLRQLCLALPEAIERLSHGGPSWFAGKGRMFANYAGQHHGFEGEALWLPAPEGAQAALIARAPLLFFRPPYVGHRGWLGVDLSAGVDWQELAGFIEEGYRLVAAKRLVALLDAAR